MRHKVLIAVLQCLMLCLALPAIADHNPWTSTFYFENDLFNGTDSNYTNGSKLSIISPDLSPHAHDGKLPRQSAQARRTDVPEHEHQYTDETNADPQCTRLVDAFVGAGEMRYEEREKGAHRHQQGRFRATDELLPPTDEEERNRPC